MRLELVIDGMVAVHAKAALFQALAAVAGIRAADVQMGRAELELSGDVDEAALRAAVESVGLTLREWRQLPRTLPTL